MILGLLEGVLLSSYSLVNVFFLGITLLQAILPLAIGSVYGIFYFVSLLILLRLNKHSLFSNFPQYEKL